MWVAAAPPKDQCQRGARSSTTHALVVCVIDHPELGATREQAAAPNVLAPPLRVQIAGFDNLWWRLRTAE
ncbi:hypothetical protein [Actinomycetospora chibensis]|uniref:Uncharacterized protein n=1 Tax=Actinomycetospora chibensis TaxID=663606 RepID=A0ABV9RNJ0_9PSEU|nr:hypothetical protein [Actinomycetospora chibensis]MDD7923211.1 hypothetical protein [Actinomycetospora chibensis]